MNRTPEGLTIDFSSGCYLCWRSFSLVAFSHRTGRRLNGLKGLRNIKRRDEGLRLGLRVIKVGLKFGLNFDGGNWGEHWGKIGVKGWPCDLGSQFKGTKVTRKELFAGESESSNGESVFDLFFFYVLLSPVTSFFFSLLFVTEANFVYMLLEFVSCCIFMSVVPWIFLYINCGIFFFLYVTPYIFVFMYFFMYLFIYHFFSSISQILHLICNFQVIF